jgi:hypothetical protein
MEEEQAAGHLASLQMRSLGFIKVLGSHNTLTSQDSVDCNDEGYRHLLTPLVTPLALLLNAVLFACYHLWTPWNAPSRIVGFFPIAYVMWSKQDIGIGIAPTSRST